MHGGRRSLDLSKQAGEGANYRRGNHKAATLVMVELERERTSANFR